MDAKEIADYLTLLFENTRAPGPMVHLVAEPGDERDAVVQAFLEGIGGGHFVTPGRAPDQPMGFEMILAMLEESANLAAEDLATLVELGVNLEGIRQEALARGGAFVLVTEDVDSFFGAQLEVDPRAVVRFQVRRNELRAAPLSEWDRGYMRIPRSGGRPEFLSRDANLAREVSRAARTIVESALDD